MKFNVSYSIYEPEDCEGDHGFIAENLDLREAICEVFNTRTAHVDGVTGIEPYSRWISVYNGMEFLTGCYEHRSLHIPDNVTSASKKRILEFMRSH